MDLDHLPREKLEKLKQYLDQNFNKNLPKIDILYEDLKNIDLEIRSTQKKIENASQN